MTDEDYPHRGDPPPTACRGAFPRQETRLAGADNGTRVEFHLLMWRASDQIFKQPFSPANGKVTQPARPGLRLEPNNDVLRDTLVA